MYMSQLPSCQRGGWRRSGTAAGLRQSLRVGQDPGMSQHLRERESLARQLLQQLERLRGEEEREKV